ncbi:MAG: beta-ketoacyl synthase N-terminal-like domain-containing protein [bacterium]
MNDYEEIAIIGMGCVLPGCFTPDDLWDSIIKGQILITPPIESWRADDKHVIGGGREGYIPDRAFTNKGGYISGFSSIFDPTEFELDPEIISGLDHVFQWSIYSAKRALEDIEDIKRFRDRAGIILGNLSYPTASFTRLYENYILKSELLDLDYGVINPLNRFMSGLPAIYTAKALGLGMESYAIDAACASGLYAIKLACDRLHNREADVMLAGGVNASDSLFLHIGFSALNALSISGQCRPFSIYADGLIPSEGAGYVVLKRLQDAVEAGDRIYGIICGIGLSNDGQSGSLISPAKTGQVTSMKKALAQSGFEPGNISFIECHGTGTPIGDRIEISSMKEVYENARDIIIGSAKANFGHSITASGIFGLIKVLKSFEHGILPQTPNSSPYIKELDDSPFRIIDKPEKWKQGREMVAAVSSFGFGGNNAHVIIRKWTGIQKKIRPKRIPDDKIAVVGIGVHTHITEDVSEFSRLLFTAKDFIQYNNTYSTIKINSKDIVFPPNDLKNTLAQQLILIKVAKEALKGVKNITDKTGIYIGMGADPEINSHSLRFRLADILSSNGIEVDMECLSRVKDMIIPPLHASRVVGTMPNMPANRLNYQFNFTGPSFTVSAEELSGDRALGIAINAIRKGEIRTALVGAVDLSRDPMHEEAIRGVLKTENHRPADAAVIVVLKKLSHALTDNDTVYATICSDKHQMITISNLPGNSILTHILGHSHAASGMLHFLTAVLFASNRISVDSTLNSNPILPNSEKVIIGIDNHSFAGITSNFTIESHDRTNHYGDILQYPCLYTYSGTDKKDLIISLESDISTDAYGDCRLACIAYPEQKNQKRKKSLRILKDDLISQDYGSEDIFFNNTRLEGDIAFLYTGAGAGYSGMGRELITGFPELVDSLGKRIRDLNKIAACIYDENHDLCEDPFSQLTSTSFLCQIHSEFSRRILDLMPHAALGLSSGETNSLLALGVWDDFNTLIEEISASGLYNDELAGKFNTVKRYWGMNKNSHIHWENWHILAAVDKIKKLVNGEKNVYITIITGPNDCLISGDSASCKRIIKKIGTRLAVPLRHALAIHTPIVNACKELWKKIHTRPSKIVPDIRFYSTYLGGVYETNQKNVAIALTGQALQTIDFPKIVTKAWEDGVRIFIEHGPRDTLCSAISKILEGKPHLTVPYDSIGKNSMEQAYRAAAKLWCAGLDINLSILKEKGNKLSGSKINETSSFEFPMHRDPILLPALDAFRNPITKMVPEIMPQAPYLAPVIEIASRRIEDLDETKRDHMNLNKQIPDSVSSRQIPNTGINPRILAQIITDFHRNITDAHNMFLRKQLQAQSTFIEQILKNYKIITEFIFPDPSLLEHKNIYYEPEEIVSNKSVNNYVDSSQSIVEKESTHHSYDIAESDERASDQGALLEDSPSQQYPGPSFNKEQLKVLAAGKISSVFGPLFQKQDKYSIQVRMPEPPLLLCDRVIGINGEPGSMGKGTIWTETDITQGSWYLHHGRMPSGLFIEAGQADLLLISWLGIDFYTRGERAYRLLGCDIMFHGPLPEVGDTLRYEIQIDDHAKQGDVRLFFFHYNCHIDDQLRISVTNGQAGFFSKDELNSSMGVLWEASKAGFTESRRTDASSIYSKKRKFTEKEIEAYNLGDICGCFGDEFFLTQTHTRTPHIPTGDMCFIKNVTIFDPHGGPVGRGYLRATSPVTPDDWFFKGHFKNDPCMPGTLMAEACLQMMSFYLTGCGFTLDKDGWRFEPVKDISYRFICRGQVTPQSGELVYEVFVDEIVREPTPILFAHVLCSVDGRKAFLCERLGIQLVPDWPDSSMPELFSNLYQGASAAKLDGFVYDNSSLVHCALGKPSLAFGPRFDFRDGPVRTQRLPGPPYSFITYIKEINAVIGKMKTDSEIITTYVISDNAWFFNENNTRTMPISVLMEIGLQSCGWLSVFTLDEELARKDLLYRNLDGNAIQYREILDINNTIITHAKLTSISRVGEIIIERFKVRCKTDDEIVFSMDTVLGFFPPNAFEKQKGLEINEQELQNIKQEDNLCIDLLPYTKQYVDNQFCLPDTKLLMIDRITAYDPKGGKKKKGYLRAEKDINANDWFFKAHFFQDPVQPGSLGIEAMIQLLQFYLIYTDKQRFITNPRFEPLIINSEIEWHYRGQVTPDKRKSLFDMDILEEGLDERGYYISAEARLWLDNIKIYHAPQICLRIVSDEIKNKEACNIILNINDIPWVKDHCPTYTIPTLPITYTLELMIQTALKYFPEKKVVFIEKAEAKNWLKFSEDILRLRVTVTLMDDTRAQVEIASSTKKGEQNIFTPAALSVLKFDSSYPDPVPLNIPELLNPKEQENPYHNGTLFHGPMFQLMDNWVLGSNGAKCTVQAVSKGIPIGIINPGLLDASLHCIPHDSYHHWSKKIQKDMAAYPLKIENFVLYSDIPSKGNIRVEARFEGIIGGIPVARIWIFSESNLIATFQIAEILLPKGPIGKLDSITRKKFLSKETYVRVSLGLLGKKSSTMKPSDVMKSDWLPGTLVKLYGVEASTQELARKIIEKDHAAQHLALHPSSIIFDDAGLCKNTPLNRFKIKTEEGKDAISVKSDLIASIDYQFIKEKLSGDNNPDSNFLTDLASALIKKFVRRVVLEDPVSFFDLSNKPVIYLANHQTGSEPFLFLCLITALTNVPVKGIANQKHKDSWFGQMDQLASRLKIDNNRLGMLYFKKGNQKSLFNLLQDFLRKSDGTSLLIHIEGTRSLVCGNPVKKLSSVLIDLSINRDMPIIPVRFIGGLPREGNTIKMELPYRMGQQDYYIGKAIMPDQLACQVYADRKRFILKKINTLGPSLEEEKPLSGDSTFIEKVEYLEKQFNMTPIQAIFFKIISGIERPSAETSRFINFINKNDFRNINKKLDSKTENILYFFNNLRYRQ